MFATIQLVIFTDFVADVEMKSRCGWMLISTVTLFFIVNMYLILKDALRLVWLNGKYIWVRLSHRYCKAEKD